MLGEAELRARGLRVTRPRLAVLAVLAEHRGEHLDVDEIATLVRARLHSVSTQAVYDVLNALARVGLARRIEPAGSPARFELRSGDDHHHVVCRGCGRIADVECVAGRTPCVDPQAAHGFLIDEAEVTFWGLCPACQPSPADAAGGDAGLPPPRSRSATADHGSRAGAEAPAGQVLR
jgi:Fur family ferric uptake transcriptional regulator